MARPGDTRARADAARERAEHAAFPHLVMALLPDAPADVRARGEAAAAILRWAAIRSRFMPRATVDALEDGFRTTCGIVERDLRDDLRRELAAGLRRADPRIGALIRQAIAEQTDCRDRVLAEIDAEPERVWSAACDEIADLGPAPDLTRLDD